MSNQFRIVVLIFSFCTNYLIAQDNATPIVVRVNYSCLNFDIINNYDVRRFNFEDVLNEKGITLLEPLLETYPEIGKYTLRKIFPNLTTNDTVSISRLGQRVTIPPFWATFQVLVPKSTNSYKFMVALDKQTKLIDFVHAEIQAELASVPNDTLYYKQHSLNGGLPNAHINIEEAWAIQTGVPYIKIGVHDNGVEANHPDLNVVFGGGYDGSDYPEDSWGQPGYHGTPVAGIIGARRNNVTGVAGIAGGNGSDSSGCSLIDLNLNFDDIPATSYFMAAVVDAARSVGSYWLYDQTPHSGGSDYFYHAPGFGVHVGNHSYVLRTDLPQLAGEKDLNPGGPIILGDCELCREAFLFSLLNGVINVAARGNSNTISSQGQVSDPTYVQDLFPQLLPDNWIISVGASGYDGITVQDGVNQSYFETLNNFFSLYGGNMDLIAPGSDSIVYTTAPYYDTIQNPYKTFNGTSAAAPHVSGVVGLLLSHYNKDCYSNKNLSIEDVEYILEKSATDVHTAGFDTLTGAGRLNAGAALKMIETPALQIVHPDLLLTSQIIERDTISLRYNKALVAEDWGPISTPFPLERERNYQVERLLVENTYSFDEYINPGTTEILDYWVRPSASNGVKYYMDTVTLFLGPLGSIDTSMIFDKFDLEPYDTIVVFDTILNIVKTRGYYYHFINKYFDVQQTQSIEPLIPESAENYWYPIDPTSDTARLVISIYIKDTTLVSYYDSPCDSTNLLYDENFPYLSLEEENTNLIKVFPNPFSETITIQFNREGTKKELIVHDIQGKHIEEHQTNNNSYTLNTKHYVSGFYFLTCRMDDKEFNFKIIKQ